jgi:hypothetical protein
MEPQLTTANAIQAKLETGLTQLIHANGVSSFDGGIQ